MNTIAKVRYNSHNNRNTQTGILTILTAAFLFGISAPMVKMLLGKVSPFYLTGLLYAGGGLGISLVAVLMKVFKNKGGSVSPVQSYKGKDYWWLAGTLLTGILGPILLTMGLLRTPAATASLFLNSESILTALIAYFLFRETVDRRIWLAILTTLLAGVVLSYEPENASFTFPLNLFLIIGACLMWAFDSNLTRMLADKDPYPLAQMKGYAAGLVSILIAVISGEKFPEINMALAVVIVGAFCYGISLVMFIYGLRYLGTARNGAYFGTAPFIGAAGSILFLHEPVTWNLVIAFVLLSTGMGFLMRETLLKTRNEHGLKEVSSPPLLKTVPQPATAGE